MDWQTVEQNWAEYTDELLTRFPDLCRDKVTEIAGSFSEFCSYLASSHDLTESEAVHTVEDWLLARTDLVPMAAGARSAA